MQHRFTAYKGIGESEIPAQIINLNGTHPLLYAAKQMKLDSMLFRMNKLGIPQKRISRRFDITQQAISSYIQKMPTMAKLVNSDLEKGFTVTQMAEKHVWHESLVWSLKLEKGGWEMTHFIQAPMSSERFQANVVAAMQKKKILGVTSRYVVVARKA